jgi:hypothetical protein
VTHGVNNNRRVPCSVSVHHGWHPSNELCGSCPAPVVKAWVPPSVDYHDENGDYLAAYPAYTLAGGAFHLCYEESSDTYLMGGRRYEGRRMRQTIASTFKRP